MQQTGRNAPCPCGSKKKYKKCCWQKEQQIAAEEARVNHAETALDRTLEKVCGWYDSNVEALGGGEASWFLEAVGEQGFEAICLSMANESDEDRDYFGQLLFMMELEKRLFDDAEVAVGTTTIGPLDVLLRKTRCPGLTRGPELDRLERSWLEAWSRSPLRLYDIVATDPDLGSLTFEDLMSRERLQVVDKIGSENLPVGLTVAARVISGDDQLPRAGNLWGLTPIGRDETLSQLRSSKGAAGDPRVFASVVRNNWLRSCLPMDMPDIVNMGSGDPLLLTTVHYQVRDWDALSAAMDGLEEWAGSREDGWVWLEPSDTALQRSLSSLNLSEDYADRVELFSRSSSMAERARSIVESAAGKALGRLHTESLGADELLTGVSAPRSSAHEESETQIPAEEMTEMVQALYEERLYAEFFDTPLPVLDGQAPKDAMKTRNGAQKVAHLIDDYKANERRMAASQDREPASLAFLEEKFRELSHDG